jgi:hypothetical protein
VQVVASKVDWPAAVERMRGIGMDRLASTAIDRVERLFGPLSGQAHAAALGHPGWRGLNTAVDATWSVTTRAKPFPSVLMSAGRATRTATAEEMVRQLVTSFRRHTGLRTLTSEGGPLTWSHAAGGPAERDRYFRDVESGRYGR